MRPPCATTRELERAVEATGRAMRAFPRGPMGLTPDSVKITPEYKTARRAFQKAFEALRAHNQERARG